MGGSDGERNGAETLQTLERGMRLLELLAAPENAGGLTITDAAKQLDVGRAMVYRLVATFATSDYVRRDGGGRLHLGMGLTAVTRAITPRLAERAAPVLRELADAVGATAHLAVAEGEQARALAVVTPSTGAFYVAYRTGARHPLDRGAAGRAILAGRTGDDALVFSSGELQPGAHGAALPVLSESALEASVGVVSLEPLTAEVVEDPLRRAAADLAAEFAPSV